ncbi:MAG: hypothetical protein OIN83_09030 [Candidatus Methanoperedens sp.]|nr:hypothetical protein [Candidatus Methanoperedens sp.]
MLTKLLIFSVTMNLILGTATAGYQLMTLNYVIPINPPSNLQASTGNFYVNTTWIGNDPTYNVNVNGNWTNGTSNKYVNISLGPHAWSNVSVCNIDICDSLNVQIPNNPITIEGGQNLSVNTGSNILLNFDSSDEDGDIAIYSTNATLGSLDTISGIFTWTNVAAGTYIWNFSVNDGYGSTSSFISTIVVTLSSSEEERYVWPQSTSPQTLTDEQTLEKETISESMNSNKNSMHGQFDQIDDLPKVNKIQETGLLNLDNITKVALILGSLTIMLRILNFRRKRY